MEVLGLTVFLSLVLAAIFIVAFLGHARKPGAGCVEREALLPLERDGADAGKHKPIDS